MSNIFSRTEALLGKVAMEKIADSTVCIFGVGGVGSFALEAIVRAGVGQVIIVDHAAVDATNINRQLIALNSTVGKMKTKVAIDRMKDINPNIRITAFDEFADLENISRMIPSNTDYIIDAIDSVSSKLDLIEYADENKISIICCMGTGNKLHPEKLKISDIYKTSVDPLARVMRSELKKRGIKKCKVVWSDEIPALKGADMPENKEGKKVPASISFVPSSAGLLLASEVINHLADTK